MDLNEIQNEVQSAISEVVANAVSSYFANATKPEKIEEFAKSVIDCSEFRRGFYDYFAKYVANEIGNQLRVWYPLGAVKDMDKAFKEAWTPNLEKALNDRIRSKALDTVDTLILERLEEVKTHLKRTGN